MIHCLIQPLQSQFYSQMLIGLSLTATKLSILFFYNRIFPSDTFATLSITTGIVQVAWVIALCFTTIFSCSPITFYWDKFVPGGSCLNIYTIGYVFTGINVVTDIVVLLLPVPLLSNLQMSLAKKLNVIGIFILGGLWVFSIAPSNGILY